MKKLVIFILCLFSTLNAQFFWYGNPIEVSKESIESISYKEWMNKEIFPFALRMHFDFPCEGCINTVKFKYCGKDTISVDMKFPSHNIKYGLRQDIRTVKRDNKVITNKFYNKETGVTYQYEDGIVEYTYPAINESDLVCISIYSNKVITLTISVNDYKNDITVNNNREDVYIPNKFFKGGDILNYIIIKIPKKHFPSLNKDVDLTQLVFKDGDSKIMESKETFALFQNTPNPFTDKTDITFKLTDSGLTTLKIYDMYGNEVTTLVNNTLTSGIHTYSFNINKLNGELKSGTYICELVHNNVSLINKILLLK